MKKLSLAVALLLLVLPATITAQAWNITRLALLSSTSLKVDTSYSYTTRTVIDTVRRIDTTATPVPALTGLGVKVAVLDNGVDITAPALKPAGGVNVRGGAWSEVPDVCDGHGSHVFGIVRQIAPQAEIHAVKVSVTTATGCATFTSDVVSGLNWAVANKMRVVVISKWVPWSSGLANAVTDAVNAGVIVVAAAGNGGTVTAPARLTGVIAVASVGPTGLVSGFSSQGPQILVAAPGENILSNVPLNQLATKSGTSMAAPHVAGVVALLLQAVPTATPAQISAALCKGAVDVMPLGRDNFSGCGIVNASQALIRLRTP